MCSATLRMRTLAVNDAPESLAPPLWQGKCWVTKTVPFGVHIHNLVFVFITGCSRLGIFVILPLHM